MQPEFSKAFEGLSKVNLKGGIVSKVVIGAICAIFALATVAVAASNVWISAAAIGMIFTLALVMFWRVINFADRHPQAALLEGAEFLAHEQIVHAAKSMPDLPLGDLEQIQPEEVEGPAADPELAAVPDQEVIEPPTDRGQK